MRNGLRAVVDTRLWAAVGVAAAFAAVAPAASAETWGQQRTVYTGHAVRHFAVDPEGDVFLLRRTVAQEIPAGSAKPIRLPFRGLVHPSAIGADAAGDVWVADPAHSRLLELRAGTSTPTRVPLHNFRPLFMSVAPNGAVYLRGNAAANHRRPHHPSWRAYRLAAGSGTAQLVYPAYGTVAADAAGDFYAGGSGRRGSPLAELTPGSTTFRQIFSRVYGQVSAVSEDGRRFFITHYTHGTVVEWGRSTHRTHTLPFTGLVHPWLAAVDANDDVFVLDYGTGVAGGTRSVVELPLASSGDLFTDSLIP